MSPQSNQFLHRQNYRRRRMTDAARLLPLAGVVLLLIPLLLEQTAIGDPAARTSRVGFYIFFIWAGLIACAYGLSWVLRAGEGPDTEIRQEDESTP